MGLPKRDREKLLPYLSPPAEPGQVAHKLSMIKVRLRKESAAATHRRLFGAPPSDIARDLQELQRAFDGLSIAARLALQPALEEAFWGGPGLRTAIRAWDGSCATDTPIGVDRLALAAAPEPTSFPIHQAIGDGITLALARLKPRPDRNPGAIPPTTRQAARELIGLFCEVHASPAPKYSRTHNEVANPEPAEFALVCLHQWKNPGVLGVDTIDLVKSL